MNLHVTKTGHVLTSQSSFPEGPCFILDTKAVLYYIEKGISTSCLITVYLLPKTFVLWRFLQVCATLLYNSTFQWQTIIGFVFEEDANRNV